MMSREDLVLLLFVFGPCVTIAIGFLAGYWFGARRRRVGIEVPLRTINLGPHDQLVLETEHHFSTEQRRYVEQQVRDALARDARVLVLHTGLHLSALVRRQAEALV